MVFDEYLLSELGASHIPGRAGGEEAMAEGHPTPAGICSSGNCFWCPTVPPLRQLALQLLPHLGASSSAFQAAGRWLWLHSTFQASRKTSWQMQYLSFLLLQTEGGIMEGGEANSASCYRTLWAEGHHPPLTCRQAEAQGCAMSWRSHLSWSQAYPTRLPHSEACISLQLIGHSRVLIRPKLRV